MTVDTSADGIRAAMNNPDRVHALRLVSALAAERDALRHSLDAADILAAALRDARDRLAAENARMREALRDLMTWFPDKPSPPEWRLPGGQYGADAAVEAARAALGDTRHD